MVDCIFCKIINEEIPSFKLAEGKHCIAFLDAFPVSKGHFLIVPKRHVEDLINIEKEEWVEIGEFAQRLGKAVLYDLPADGFTFLQRNGKAAGQEVPHIHFHVIPRFKGDNLKCWSSGSKAEEIELKKLASLIKRHL